MPNSALNGIHLWTARAYDAVGNGATSAPVRITVALETNPPTVSIVSPAPDSIFTNAQTVEVIAAASDDAGLAKVEFYDGQSLKGTVLSPPFTFLWNITLADVRTHIWSAKAYDVNGNVSISPSIFLTVATCSPGWVSVTNGGPSARYMHEMATDPLGGVVLFGGWYLAPGTWVWSGNAWLQKSPATTPPLRSGHALVYDEARRRVLLFGGYYTNRLADTWEWDGTNWTRKFPAVSPPARDSHAMAYDVLRQRVVLFGGYSNVRLGDTWEWDGTNWVQKVVTGPPSRTDFDMAYDPLGHGILLFGGWGSNAPTADTWLWDGEIWVQKSPLVSPSARHRHRMSYNFAGGHVILYGGSTRVAPLGDTWEWDGITWREMPSIVKPPPRYKHAIAYNYLRNRLMVFGGMGPGNNYLGDTWELVSVDSPLILMQPSNRVALAGNSIGFSVNVSGSPPLRYQWRKDGIPLTDGADAAGVNSDTLLLTAVQLEDVGNFDVVVSGNCGFVVSSNAALRITAITAQPQNQDVIVSNSATFSVSAVGQPPLTYRWRFGPTFIPGATNSSFTTNNVRCASAGSYSVIVSNAAGSITSAPAALTISFPPTITTHPTNQIVNITSNVTFRVVSTNCSSSLLRYQWRFNGEDIPGATATNLTLTAVDTNAAGTYDVVVTNVAGRVTSSSASLTVITPPANLVICRGMNAEFCANAEGPLLSSYQWRSNSVTITNATNFCYTRINVQTTNTIPYSVIVSNASGRRTNTATLTVHSLPPTNTANPVSRIVAAGSNATFCVTAQRATRYQWRFNTNDIPGATSNCFTLTNCQPDDAGTYSVVVGNDCGITISSNASLTIAPPPLPVKMDVLAGVDARLCEPVIGTGPFGYQWRFNNTSLPGATNSCYTRTNVQLTQGGLYSVRVTNSAGSATSAVATLVVHVPPAITQQPIYDIGEIGKTSVFFVTAVGTVPTNYFNYQWRFNGVDLPGKTNRILVVENVQTTSAGDYSVLVSNLAGSIVSSNASLVVQAWSARYTGFGASADQPKGIALGSNDLLYVTGFANYGNGYSNDYATLCYSFADVCGTNVWPDSSGKYNGLAKGDDKALALALDSSGDVYVTGYSTGTNTGRDYATVKYRSGGAAVWTNTYNGPANGADEATNIVVDIAGNVYVTGASLSTTSSFDYATIKYNAAGLALWTNRYSSAGSYADRPTAMAVDSGGNLYVTGYAHGTGDDYATLKYDSNGALIWTNRYTGPGSNTDQPTAIAVNSSGEVYVTGYSYRGSSGSYDYATIKYDANGAAVWTNRYSSSGTYADRATALALDASGNVYVTGYSHGTGDDFTTLKYDPNGILLWTNRYNGPGNSTDQPAAIAVDNEGNVYVTGFATSSGTGRDFATVKYDPNGVEKWVALGISNRADQATLIAVDNAGSIYVAGFSSSSSSDTDYTMVRYVQMPINSSCTNTSSRGLRPAGVGGGGSDSLPTIPPSIVTEPESQVVLLGRDATFTAEVDGSLPFTYQWRFNSTNIPGATAPSYTVINAQPGHAGEYSLVVTNVRGAVASQVVRLTILITLPQLQSPQISEFGEFTFSLLGDPGYIYSIEMSEDLIEWSPVATVVNTTGEVQLIDPNPRDSTTRFYRVTPIP